MNKDQKIQQIEKNLNRNLHANEIAAIEFYLETLEDLEGSVLESFVDDSLSYPESSAQIIGKGFQEVEMIRKAREFLTKWGEPQ